MRRAKIQEQNRYVLERHRQFRIAANMVTDARMGFLEASSLRHRLVAKPLWKRFRDSVTFAAPPLPFQSVPQTQGGLSRSKLRHPSVGQIIDGFVRAAIFCEAQSRRCWIGRGT
jgi:hypothetical protein